ncbi:hypothetical protein PAXRUDRAFT_824661 [Paxillus rubicundulus Ve08.2h10]|uniref:Uncharacterized protein n=1 Tax=Paxillus rubicundulus Ve08.2h10 TaxID=930991 RepID=A0A0D0DHI2_9AGAM|nr:hypothetical protein PAXRUDRAFT_824661 [Paxillus rubicundulus Ve08.2h10]
MPSTRDRERSRSQGRDHELPDGISKISESDYFQKNSEFSVWLKDEKGKYFSELSGEKARSYFRKFVKTWNRGKLPESIYRSTGSIASSAANQTAYKWSFASKCSNADVEALQAAREEVGSATYHRGGGPSGSGSGGGRILGPALPSTSDLILSREAASEFQAADRDRKRKRDRVEAKEHVEDMVGPKEVGREGMLEKKRARRESNKDFREKGDDGFEADESTLLGGGDSFKDHIARRDAARKRFQEKRVVTREDNAAGARERANAMREKDRATMDMFQQLAKQRYG